jgi:hypothetical protein
MPDILDCRKKAAECLILAETETPQPLKTALTNVAQSWSNLAYQLELLDEMLLEKSVKSVLHSISERVETPEFDVEAFVTKLDRIGIKLILGAKLLAVRRWRSAAC